MKVIAINASARKDGNTAILIKEVFKELNNQDVETEIIQLSKEVIEPCKACFACGGKGNCVHKKDIFNRVFEKMKEADGIILGSPTYSANISATMQAILERAAVVVDMNPGIMKHKAGAAVVTARRGGAVNTVDAMNHFFLNHEMFVTGSIYWNIGYGQMPGDVKEDKEALANMTNLGQNMAYLLKSLSNYENK